MLQVYLTQMFAQPMTEDCLLTDALEYTNKPYAIAKIAELKMYESYNLQHAKTLFQLCLQT